MPDFEAKMHQIRFLLGLRWGSLQLTGKEEGKGRWRKGKEGEGMGELPPPPPPQLGSLYPSVSTFEVKCHYKVV